MDLIAKTLYGLENVLAGELEQLGALKIVTGNRAVKFKGDEALLYRANYSLRTALSILKPIHKFRINTSKDLYIAAVKFNWDEYLEPDQTFSIVPVVHSSLFNHSGYAGLVLKDAVADNFRRIYNRRPSVDTKNPDVVINLHISEHDVNISLDSSVIPLFKRGYRTGPAKAPLNEVLAAGIILISGWDRKQALLDPMCGSGTIPIEAALIAGRISPGKFRTFFGFMNWKDYNKILFESIKKEEDAGEVTITNTIRCSDNAPFVIRTARSNIQNAGLLGSINSRIDDFLNSSSGGKSYTIFINPPYGERLKQEDIGLLYNKIGERLKHGYPSSNAWIISSNIEGMKNLGLKPAEKYTLFNGALECRLMKFELYSGSIKS